MRKPKKLERAAANVEAVAKDGPETIVYGLLIGSTIEMNWQPIFIGKRDSHEVICTICILSQDAIGRFVIGASK